MGDKWALLGGGGGLVKILEIRGTTSSVIHLVHIRFVHKSPTISLFSCIIC